MKNIIGIVQQGVDRNGTGVVRKEEFLLFCEEIMGIDCLLSPDIIFLNSMGPVRKTPGPPKSKQVRSSPPPISTQLPIVPLNSIRSNTTITSPSKNTIEVSAMAHFRVKSAVRILTQFTFAKTWRSIILATRSKLSVGIAPPVVQIPRLHHGDCIALLLTICKVRQRVILNSLRYLSMRPVTEVINAEVVSSNYESSEPPGPSWTVTIQAVAITNLFGVIRGALARSKLVGYFTIRTGRTLDENYSMRMVSWSQSKQARKDAHAASTDTREVLAPIHENSGDLLEFDLSQ
jgi:hypothetical protein